MKRQFFGLMLFVAISCGKLWAVNPQQPEHHDNHPQEVRPDYVAIGIREALLIQPDPPQEARIPRPMARPEMPHGRNQVAQLHKKIWKTGCSYSFKAGLGLGVACTYGAHLLIQNYFSH